MGPVNSVTSESVTSEAVRWGILGSGRVADGFARGLTSSPGSELVAVSSRDPANARSFATRHGAVRAHADHEALVADPDIDVIYVATPNDRHADDAVMSLAHGKAVLCEKPFTTDADSAERVIAEARSRRLFCMEAMWMRFIPAVQRVAELVGAGEIGEVRSVHADFSQAVEVDPTSRFFDPALGGGALFDLGVYTLSFAQLLLGEPTRVSGRLQIGPTGVDELAAVVLAYESGATAVLTSSLRSTGPNGAVIAGTRGTIRLAGPLCAPTSFAVDPVVPARAGAASSSQWRDRVLANPRAASVVRRGLGLARRVRSRSGRSTTMRIVGTGYQYEADEVVRCLRAGELESPAMQLDDSLRVVRLTERLRSELAR